jgi:hypothetical protein
MKPKIEIKDIEKGIQITITAEAPDTVEAIRKSTGHFFEALSNVELYGRALGGHPHRNEFVP